MEPEEYMKKALNEARCASSRGEVPVGCIVTDSRGNIIGTGQNRCESLMDATAHAELEAIRSASRALKSWRLDGCSIYVTLEPCPMCAGAIINSRIKKVFYGAREPRTGSCGSVINLFMENYPHEPEITGGILQDECAGLMSGFFRSAREK